jgi:hypothetical protein
MHPKRKWDPPRNLTLLCTTRHFSTPQGGFKAERPEAERGEAPLLSPGYSYPSFAEPRSGPASFRQLNLYRVSVRACKVYCVQSLRL